MKKNKLLMLLLVIPLLLTGCFKDKNMDGITIYTTSYPIEYVTKRLYEDHSTIKSIYPTGIHEGYKVSDKLLEDYSKGDLFIFNSLNEYYELDKDGNLILTNNLPTLVSEKTYAYKMLTSNRDLKIIDVSASIDYDNSVYELWLDPIKLLTVANNIKKGFNEYTSSTYLVKEIDENYQKLKEELLKLDADYREVANRATHKYLVVGDDLLKYLSKYNIEIISLEENDNLSQKTLKTVTDLIEAGDVTYIYTVKGKPVNDTINQLLEEYADYNIQVIELDSLNVLSEEDIKNDYDYFTIMYNNLDKIKEELYQ